MNNYWEKISDRELAERERIPYPGNRELLTRTREKAGIRRAPGRGAVRIVAGLAAAAVLSLGAFAGYEHWHMPDHGVEIADPAVEVSEINSYSELPADPEEKSDAWFIAEAQKVLSLLTRSPAEGERYTVAHLTDLYWGREARKIYVGGQTVSFDAESGYLLSVSDFTAKEQGAPLTPAEGEARAAELYALLPYPQGYTLTEKNKPDSDCVMYTFSKTVTMSYGGKTQTLENPYEAVKLTLDLSSGTLLCANSFYVPLLDDHTDGMTPITEADAVRTTSDFFFPDGIPEGERWEAQDATPAIALPAPGRVKAWRTGEQTGAESAYGITRLAVRVELRRTDVSYACAYIGYVDLYTGEILTVDQC